MSSTPRARNRRTRPAILVAFWVVSLAGTIWAEPFTGELDLILRGAVSHDWTKPDGGRNLFLHLEARDGVWRRVWGKAQNFGVGEHVGIVEASEVTGRAIQLKIALLVQGDFWVKGTWPGSYEISAERKADGSVSGEFTGTFKGRAVSGVVEGRMPPSRPIREGVVPPGPDEHPRLLFRKSDVPRLRKKLETPLGRAYLSRVEDSDDLINLGVLYQLTGERGHAERARRVIATRYKDEIPVFGFGSGGFGHDVFRTAVTYDLCKEAWPEPFCQRLSIELHEFTLRHQFVLMTSHANFHPCSNYYGPGRGVPGICSMALWGDKGIEPQKPRDPLARTWPILPPKDFTPGKGVRVTDLEVDRCPRSWIWTGPLPGESSRDVLHSLGGYAKARPEVGTTASLLVKSEKWFKKAPFAFEALPAELVGDVGIDLAKALGGDQASVTVYFTAVRVATEQVLGLLRGSKETRVWLSGVELEDGRFYRVRPGVHPMTVEHRAKKNTGVLSPRLAEPTHPALRGRLESYRLELALWKEDHALWQRTGMDPVRQLLLDRGWWQNFQHYRWGIGDGGFQAETGGYANISSWYPSVYASMYSNYFGRAVSPYPDVSHLIPRKMMQSVFVPGGRPFAMKLNSVAGVDIKWMAAHFPILPDRYKPAALWVWNYLAGVTDAATVTNLLGHGKRRRLDDITLAQTFVNYPLDVRPVHPSEGMPRTWRADTFGFYIFRSGWQKGEEFVSQVFLKAAPVRGWNHPNAGSFQVYGLGHPWTTSSESRNGVREQESVVLLPDDEVDQGSCGRLVHYEAGPDGSGNLTIDMSDVYAAPSRGLYDSMLIRNGDERKPGLEGLRAMAFDYSGKCGAPALLVLVDKIEGGGKKVWTWQRPEAKVEVEANAFTIAYPDATMRATFVTPAEVRIESISEDIKVGTARDGFHGKVHRVKATGGDSYFVVLTFQREEPPKVSVEGRRLEARVTVGGQSVRFDGGKILVGR